MIKFKLAFLSIFILINCIHVVCSNKYTISGYIRDIETGEELIGATISIDSTNQGIVSNSYGFYSITIQSGINSINYSFVGYEGIHINLFDSALSYTTDTF